MSLNIDCITMSTLTIKLPDEMEDDLDAYLKNNPHYLNRSELVRDALRHMIERPRLSAASLQRVEQSERDFERGDYVSLEDV
jgi:Arc/MetJ-type ribon-helix-helix transcriptional regulator